MKSLFCLCLFAVLVYPYISHAQIIITEIMYDVPGSDSGREWVEIVNDGAESVDVSGWWFFDGSNHGFQNESAVLESGEYAVIVDDVEKFLLDWPNLGGLILDSSSFSLKNTGEYIAIKDKDKNDADGLSFIPLETADGQGNSLQLVSGVWIAASPTPGVSNSVSTGSNQEDIQSNSASSAQQGTGLWIEDTKRIYADAGDDRIVFVGADSLFEGQAFGFTKEPIENARYIWNFGDGASKEGERVFYSYKYPGEYAVFLDVASGKYSASDRIKIKAVPAEIEVSSLKEGEGGFIELHNKSKKELNLSWWRLLVAGAYYTFPEHTYLLPETKVIFPAEKTGLVYVGGVEDVALSYPNGDIAAFYETNSTASFQSGTPVYASKSPRQEPLVYNKEEWIMSSAEDIVENPEAVHTAELASSYKSGETIFEAASSLFRWLLVLFSVVCLSFGGILFVAHKERKREHMDIAIYNGTAREIKIIDEL